MVTRWEVRTKRRVVTGMSGLLLVAAAAGIWRAFFAMPVTPLSEAAFVQAYAYPATSRPVDAARRDPAQSDPAPLTLVPDGPLKARFQYRGFDGDRVHGFIEWPADPTTHPPEGFPVLLGISAMGHSAQRWWHADYKGRPTITETHQIRALAIAAGYAVVSIDNRYTDSRKDPAHEIDDIMWDLHVYGDKSRYQKMVHGTVMDLRQLLDKLALQPELDLSRLTVAGYSMGAQVGLLLTGVDQRVQRLIAMVPPHLDDRTAVVAAKNAAPLIRQASVLLLTADDDPYASPEQNAALFAAIATADKRHLRHDSGHVLPANYLDALRPLFSR